MTKPKREKTGGRKKGVRNKLTANLKTAILGALAAKGGQDYLEKVATDDPRTFCALLGKVLPLQLTGDENEAVHIATRQQDAAEELQRRWDRLASAGQEKE